jgi:hypothetical protein
MLAWATAAALVCAISATLGLGSVDSFPSSMQNIALFISAIAAFVLFASFEAHEAQGPMKKESED